MLFIGILSAPAAQAAPTADQLSAAVRTCTQQISAGKYAERSGGARTIPVCATGNAVHWRSGMTIDCDGQRTAKCNESTDPSWQNQTAWPQSDGRALNAETLPYIVVPGVTSTWSYRDAGITGGTVAAVVYNQRLAYAVVGDVGPDDQVGEGSYALAQKLGINPDPRTGGVSGKVVDYILFPGVNASPIQDAAKAVALGEQAAAQLLGCGSVNLNYIRYPQLTAGATGNEVKAAQCLLGTTPSGTLDAAPVKQFQTRVGLPATGTIDSHTWTALLSAGATPQVQNGSTGEAVVRLQRSLNAAVAAALTMDGNFGPNTGSAAKQYQSTRGLTADGIVGPNTWGALQGGK